MPIHFRIISVRTYSQGDIPEEELDEVRSIYKVLKFDTTYTFCSGSQALYKDLASLNQNENEQHPYVNVHAIVGKNGDGKSSLVELVIRIINNVIAESINVGKHLVEYVPHVYAKLRYKSGNRLCEIDCQGSTMYFRYIEDNKKKTVPIDKGNVFNIHLKQFDWSPFQDLIFNTLVVNESIFSYNSNDFYQETSQNNDGSWLDALFYRCEDNRVPLLLSPNREKGNIDINVENNLSRQRLLSLLIENKGLRNIFRAKTIEYSLSTIDYFKEYTIRRYFESFSSDNGLYRYPNGAKKFLKDMDTIKCQYPNLLAFALKTVHETRSMQDESNNKAKSSKGTTNLANVFGEYNLGEIGHLNFRQFQRLVEIVKASEFWSKKLTQEKKSKYVNIDDCLNKNDTISVTFRYLIYLTLKATEEKQKNTLQNFVSKLIRENLKSEKNVLQEIEYETFRVKLSSRLGILQAFNFLSTKSNYRDFGSSGTILLKDYLEKLQYMMSVEEHSIPQNIIEYLFPPCFNTDVNFEIDGSDVKFNHMSSGERQMLYSLANIVYFLQNVDHMDAVNGVYRYKFVNIILEEIELYLHPAYQQDFIHRLLGIIGSTHFDRIEGINICLVTHSPFLLSDIPKCNILYLIDGHPVDRSNIKESFGANINDILHDSFFLNKGFMGSNTKEILKDLIIFLSDSNPVCKYHWNIDVAKRIIDLIGDPLLKIQMERQLDNYVVTHSDSAKEKLIQELEVRIKRLRKGNA